MDKERANKKPRRRDLVLSFEQEELKIIFGHNRIATKEDVDSRKLDTQQRILHSTGRLIPTEHINVWPDIGDPYYARSWFKVKPNEPLHFGLHKVHERNPETLPKLISNLEWYAEFQNLNIAHKNLLQETIEKLRGITEVAKDYKKEP